MYLAPNQTVNTMPPSKGYILLCLFVQESVVHHHHTSFFQSCPDNDTGNTSATLYPGPIYHSTRELAKTRWKTNHLLSCFPPWMNVFLGFGPFQSNRKGSIPWREHIFRRLFLSKKYLLLSSKYLLSTDMNKYVWVARVTTIAKSDSKVGMSEKWTTLNNKQQQVGI